MGPWKHVLGGSQNFYPKKGQYRQCRPQVSLGLSKYDPQKCPFLSDRVAFKLIVTVHRCLNGRAPNYLSNHVVPVSAIVSWQHLRSAQQNTLVVPRYRLTTYGHRAFSVAGPTAWNSLPVAFRDPTISDACFRRHLKTVLFAQQRRHHSV